MNTVNCIGLLSCFCLYNCMPMLIVNKCADFEYCLAYALVKLDMQFTVCKAEIQT